MKSKIVLLIIANVVLGSLFAQKNPTFSEINASKVIQLVNSVTNLRNYYLDNIEGFKSTLETANSNIERYKVNNSAPIYFINCNNIVAPNNSLKSAYEAQIKQNVTFAEKDSLLRATQDANLATSNLEAACSELSNYFSKKEFSTDFDFSRFQTLSDNLKNQVNSFVNTWLKASDIANDAGNKAEIELISKSKIAEFIIPMKQDLFRMNKILNLLNAENINTNEVIDELTALSNNISKNKDISTKEASKLSDYYYREVYTTFYRNLDNCLAGAKKLATRLETNDVDDSINSLAASIYSYYDEAVNSYNSFIAQ